MARKQGPDARILAETGQILGTFFTLRYRDLRRERKDWEKAWRESGVSAAEFLVRRYGFEVTSSGRVVPTRGEAARRPLDWGRSTYTQAHAAALIRAVAEGRIDSDGFPTR